MRVLVIGSGGMLGYTTFRYLKDRGHQVSGLTRTKTFPGMVNMDAADPEAMGRFLERESFDAVINCAALLLKASEERKSEAVRLNAWLPHFLNELCARRNTYLIQVSTDGVFSGTKGRYQETSFCDGDTFYGRSKLLGEVCGSCALTVRSAFWGVDVNANGVGLLQWFLRQSGSVSGYTKAFFNGVSNLEFARFAESAIWNRWTGIYHLCAADMISKYEFLCLAKHVFSREIAVGRSEQVCIDRTLECTRTEIPYQQKDFRQMMEELREWASGQGCFLV